VVLFGVSSRSLGEMDGFEDRYERLCVFAFRAVLRVVGDKETARDVASEMFAGAYSRWGQVASHIELWVTGVAVNLALDVVRRRPTPKVPAEVTGEPSLDRAVLAAQLARLPGRQREALPARLDEKTTAEVLGVTVGIVKTDVTRGLNRIRQQLPC
jgi:DNA-directed RNA polymerase specialized sigma24 family protein